MEGMGTIPSPHEAQKQSRGSQACRIEEISVITIWCFHFQIQYEGRTESHKQLSLRANWE